MGLARARALHRKAKLSLSSDGVKRLRGLTDELVNKASRAFSVAKSAAPSVAPQYQKAMQTFALALRELEAMDDEE